MGAGTGWAKWACAHHDFFLFEIVWVRTAHPGFCAKILPYYDIYSIIRKKNDAFISA